jgi:hypothetical protein
MDKANAHDPFHQFLMAYKPLPNPCVADAPYMGRML